MKPAWDSLATEYADHPNVLVADVDCVAQKSLCDEYGVSGYPTIKYWVDGGGKDDAKSYSGGRTLDQLKKHVEENMLPKCSVASPGTGCSEQEVTYIEKMKAKGSDAAQTELARLEGMKHSAMKPDKKAWLAKRIHILKQI
mmetsp:Transcript_9275/g.30142  ORF Transcript_9275/g.30142 Transcript_9275/m.30142 type:complete len:141 (-) Transcript_9275:395-817(-)